MFQTTNQQSWGGPELHLKVAMLHLRMRTVEPNHRPARFHLRRGETNGNPHAFPFCFGEFVHSFSIFILIVFEVGNCRCGKSETEMGNSPFYIPIMIFHFPGWLFCLFGAKLDHFELQFCWPPRLRWRPLVHLWAEPSARKIITGWKRTKQLQERDGKDIKYKISK